MNDPQSGSTGFASTLLLMYKPVFVPNYEIT